MDIEEKADHHGKTSKIQFDSKTAGQMPICVFALSRGCHSTLLLILLAAAFITYTIIDSNNSCDISLTTASEPKLMSAVTQKLRTVVADEAEEDPISSYYAKKRQRPQKCSWTSKATTMETMECLRNSLPYFNDPKAVNPSMFFLGDSTMARLWTFVHRRAMDYTLPLGVKKPCTCSMRVMDRCYRSTRDDRVINDQFRFEDKRRREPIAALEGPTANGLDALGCMDCSSCHSRMFFCSRYCDYRPPNFIGVEFARDATIQTEHFTTTQENIAHMLATRFNDTIPDTMPQYSKLCVVSAGMHDFSIKGITDETYVENVRWYLNLLKPSCDHLLWVGLNFVNEEKRFPQRNWRIVEWNRLIEDLLRGNEFRSWTSFLDIFAVTVDWDHENSVHLEMDFYRELAHILNNAVYTTPSVFDR